MLVAAAVAALLVLEALVVPVEVVLVQQLLVELREQQTRVVVAVVGIQVQVVVAQVLSSSPTQARHNYSVVALLPKPVASSSTRLHLLAHLALCHL